MRLCACIKERNSTGDTIAVRRVLNESPEESSTGSRREARFGKVKFAFDPAEHVIVDPVLVAELDRGVAFHSQRLERKVEVTVEIFHLLAVSAGSLQARKPLAVMLGKVFIDACGFFAVVCLRGFDDGTTAASITIRRASFSSQSGPAAPARPRAWTSGGSVMPCSTSVTTITQKVRKTIRFR